MGIKTYISKQWTVRTRDWLIATAQAVIAAASTSLLDKIGVDGLTFDWREVLTVSLVVFLQHVGRKAIEPTKLVTIQKDPPPNNNDPTHPPKPPVPPVPSN